MKRFWTLAIVGAIFLAKHAIAAGVPATQSVDAVTAAGNAFAIDLYSQISKIDGNICISPYSVSSALEMATAGASGNTAKQMLAVLHWTGHPGDLPAASNVLTSKIMALGQTPAEGDPQISIANALFGQKGYPYRQSFLDLLSRQYGAALQDVDFAAQPQQASDQINHWAAKKTHDRIKNAVPTSAISPLTRLILVDAIYFKADWASEFSRHATQKQPFFSEGNNPINVSLMRQQKSFNYAETQMMQALDLPYHGDFSMVVLLAKKRDGLSALEQSLTADALNGWIANLAPQQVEVYLPKFKMEGEYQLNAPLSKLGMTDAFNRHTADFSGMISSEKLCIDQVIHKTYIAVDEAGTEAAAVTSMTVTATAIIRQPNRSKPVIFRADHPFLYVLYHRPTGAILFIGRTSVPNV